MSYSVCQKTFPNITAHGLCAFKAMLDFSACVGKINKMIAWTDDSWITFFCHYYINTYKRMNWEHEQAILPLKPAFPFDEFIVDLTVTSILHSYLTVVTFHQLAYQE